MSSPEPRLCFGCGKDFYPIPKYNREDCPECVTRVENPTCNLPPKYSFDPENPRNGQPLPSPIKAANKGVAIEGLAAYLLMLEGWEVYEATGPNSPVDLIAYRGQEVRYIEVRLGQMNSTGKLEFNKALHSGLPHPTEILVLTLPDLKLHRVGIEFL